MKIRYLAAAAVAALALGSAADAAIYVSVTVDGTELNLLNALPQDATTGLYAGTFIGGGGNVMVTLNATGKGTSTFSAPDPKFTTQALDITSSGSHTVVVRLSQTGLTSTTPLFSVTNTINAGTLSLATPALAAAYIGATNTAFLESTLIGSVLSCSTSTCDSGTMVGGAMHTPTFSETVQYNFQLTGNGTLQANTTIAAAAVPEPASWGLMVLGFGVIGGALRTSRRKVVFA